ncbi:MAG: hypothetical protein KAR13_12290 [Desulfobulbaceae bacterium]|nr:hypothetical protein [Desulfobulbaceae bacterium]
MSDIPRAPICISKVGPDWIDKGTLARTKNRSRRVGGDNYQKQFRLNNRTFLDVTYVDPYRNCPGCLVGSTSALRNYQVIYSFNALRYNEKGALKSIKLQYDNQDFRMSATTWEKRFSPLLSRKDIRMVGKPFLPVVDSYGSVIGYFGKTKPRRVFKEPNGRMTFIGKKKPNSTGTTLSGADGIAILVNVEGEVLQSKLYDYANQPSYVFDLLSLGSAIAVGVLKTGIKTLIKKAATKTAARAFSVGASKITLSKVGKYAGGNGKIIIYHGMGKGARQGFRKSKQLRFSHSKEDFASGIYTSADSKVANAISRSRGGEVVIKAEIDIKNLGKIVDVRKGGVHYKTWNEFLDKPLEYLGKPLNTTAREIVEKDAGLRGEYFLKFLKQHGLQDADAIIGPIGTKLTAGTVNFVSEQLVIRSQKVAKVITELFYRSL